MAVVWDRFVRRLEVAIRPEDWATISDGLLLERFRACRDQAAFAELVRRHGPMVLGVCRRVLRCKHDADDAFQATFLVLVRKASSLRSSDHVAGWLYGVAYRTALKARTLALRRQERERTPSATTATMLPELSEQLADRDEIAVLDEELRRLPEKYRLPIVLCDIQGQTRSQAAAALRWPEGTVAGRLVRARQLLARRLHGRGVGTAVVALPLTVAVSNQLLYATAHVASLTLLGSHAAPAAVHHLTQGVLKNMAYSKYKLMALGLMSALVFGIGWSRLGPATAQESGRGMRVATAKSQPDLEPINPELVFRKEVQQELRLSKAQIDKLSEAQARGGDHKENKEEQARIDKELAALRARMDKLNERKASLASVIRKSQREEMKRVLPGVLSNAAIKRLQELSIQELGLRTLMNDPKFIARLNLTDDQLKKWEELARTNLSLAYTTRLALQDDYLFLANANQFRTVSKELVQVWSTSDNADEFMKLLSPEQRKVWESMKGQPWPEEKK